MVHLDTSFLIHALTPGSDAEERLQNILANGESIGISAIAWSEFLCGPLTEQQKQVAALLLSTPESFLGVDAELAADLFNKTGRRSRTLADCQIAAVAMRLNAQIATANPLDFKPLEKYGLQMR